MLSFMEKKTVGSYNFKSVIGAEQWGGWSFVILNIVSRQAFLGMIYQGRQWLVITNRVDKNIMHTCR